SQAGMVEPVAAKAADLEVLDHDIGGGGKAAYQREIVGVFEVERDRPFPAVGGVEIGSIEIAAVCRGDEWRTPASGVVSRAGTLDLDDGRAEIRQVLACPRPGENARELKH